MADIASLWRHPIKSHGREALERVTLSPGQTMPWDRHWAVAHEAAKTDGTEWAPCANFSRGAKAPSLMAITSKFDDATGQLTLSHPDRDDLTFDPDREEAAFLEWARPLMPKDRAQSARLLRAQERGMTDTPFPSISLISHASLDALAEKVGQPLHPGRFRANIWANGFAPFEEFDLVGRDIQVGEVRFTVAERITRCLATTANPETGERDADTLGALQSNWGHRDLGVYLAVIKGGTLQPGDEIQVL